MNRSTNPHYVWTSRLDPCFFFFAGIPPKGYKGDMKTMSDKFHKIWLDNEELTDDYPEIMDSFRLVM